MQYFAEAMADVLAILHFAAEIDGDDIEIMLGDPLAPSRGMGSEMSGVQPLTSRNIDAAGRECSTRSGVLDSARAISCLADVAVNTLAFQSQLVVSHLHPRLQPMRLDRHV